MKTIVLSVACAAALFAVGADAAPSPHEAVRRQLAALRAKPEKAELPPYLSRPTPTSTTPASARRRRASSCSFPSDARRADAARCSTST